jgi:hypothetical protein
MPTNIRLLPLRKISLLLRNNEDWIDEIPITRDDGVTPLDITGIAFDLDIRAQASSKSIRRFSTGGSSPTLLNMGTSGILAFAVPELITKKVPAGIFIFDLRASADDLLRDAAYGTVEIAQGITRS